MSVRAMSAIWPRNLEPTRKYVMLALADCADDNLRCFPGIGFLARKTGLCNRAVQKVLRQARNEGSLVVEQQGGSGPGSRTILRIVPDKLTERPESPKGERGSPLPKGECGSLKGEPGSSKGERGSQNATPILKEPSLTVINRHSEAQSKNRPSPVPEGFEDFWKSYPRSEGKQRAIRAARKVKPSEWPAIMAGIERWKGSDQWRRGVIPHGSTFLNERRWEETPFRPGQGSTTERSQATL